MPRKTEKLRICGAPFFLRLFRLFSRLPSTTAAPTATRALINIVDPMQEATSSRPPPDLSDVTNTDEFVKDEVLDWSRANLEDEQVEPNCRYPLRFLMARWKAGEREPLEKVLRAFRAIKGLDANDRRSFTYIAGLHGQPFIQRPEVDRLDAHDRYEYWGGYCPHGTVLFPVWHRAYLDYLEKALQQFEPGVMLPYWDELSSASLTEGLPTILTDDTVTIDGQEVDNPLKSFTFPQGALAFQLPEFSKDEEAQRQLDDLRHLFDFDKPYTTVRYPLFHTGVGSVEAQFAASEANKRYSGPDGEDPTTALNENVVGWLSNPNPDSPESATTYYTSEKYKMSLSAKNYTIFSCTTSMTFYKEVTGEPGFSLEGPHNDIHDAGGFMSPPLIEPVQHAYGDMGTLETSSFDPLFWMHHCFVDRMFWFWQRLHNATDDLEVIEGFPGARSVDGFGGPTVGQTPTETLTMGTPLYPFVNCECDGYFTGNDVANIDNLGYKYKGDPYQLMKFKVKETKIKPEIKVDGSRGSVMIKNVDRTRFSGTFTVVAYLKVRDERRAAGYETVFNRLIARNCPGCLHHKMRTFVFPLTRMDKNFIYDPDCIINVEFFGEKMGDAEIEYEASFIRVGA